MMYSRALPIFSSGELRDTHDTMDCPKAFRMGEVTAEL